MSDNANYVRRANSQAFGGALATVLPTLGPEAVVIGKGEEDRSQDRGGGGTASTSTSTSSPTSSSTSTSTSDLASVLSGVVRDITDRQAKADYDRNFPLFRTALTAPATTTAATTTAQDSPPDSSANNNLYSMSRATWLLILPTLIRLAGGVSSGGAISISGAAANGDSAPQWYGIDDGTRLDDGTLPGQKLSPVPITVVQNLLGSTTAATSLLPTLQKLAAGDGKGGGGGGGTGCLASSPVNVITVDFCEHSCGLAVDLSQLVMQQRTTMVMAGVTAGGRDWDKTGGAGGQAQCVAMFGSE